MPCVLFLITWSLWALPALALQGALRSTAADSSSGDQTAYVAGEYRRTDGPVVTPQDFQRLNLFAKLHTPLSDRATLPLDASGFSSAPRATRTTRGLS